MATKMEEPAGLESSEKQSQAQSLPVTGDSITCCGKFQKFIASVSCSIFASHTLSSWGDRMWMFAVGLYLNDLSPNSLRLVASYGFSMGAVALLMGAIIGDLVDRYPRLIVARTSLICQNLSVAVCAGIVCVIYSHKEFIYNVYWRSALCEAAVIIVAIIANMFSMCNKISVQKDWIGVICEGESAKLARMSATMRAIDLVTNLVSPVLTGFIMTLASMFYSAIFIAVWNMISVMIEYALLHRVYYLVPDLAIKKQDDKQEPTETCEDGPAVINYCDNLGFVNEQPSDPGEMVERDDEEKNENSQDPEKDVRWYHKMFSSLIILVRGWRTYMSYDVKFAGLGLACLYMTVLGFDNITIGYGYGQGLSEITMGLLFAAGALVGVSATFTYPMIRRRYGIEKAGLMGFVCEISMLVLCVVSIWLPGSPFDLTRTESIPLRTTTTISPATGPDNSTLLYNNITNVTTPSAGTDNVPHSFISIGFLMAGIILARYGLWTADLAISQLLLERVESNQRGVVNGVQGSLNMLMDMLKFVLVIVAPLPSQFGVLALISFVFMCLGCVSYVVYSRKVSRSAEEINANNGVSSSVKLDDIEGIA